jgi:hypothetical protein
MPASRPPRVALVAAVLAAAAVHLLAALRTPLGAASDDALHLLLARNLLSGGYAVPGPSGTPVTDPLPGFPALMALPVGLLAPHWAWLRGAELLAAAAFVFLAWRLSRRLSGEAAGLAAAFLVAADPALVGWAGVALPDVPFSACAVAGFLLLARPDFSVAALAAVAAAAALLRPEGVILIPALAVGCSLRAGPRKAAVFLIAASAPLGLWLLRDRLVAGSATAYVEHWRSLSALADGGAFSRPALGLARGLFGPLPAPLALALFLLVLAVAVIGARRLARSRDRGVRAALAAVVLFLAGLSALHLGWRAWESRYALPFLAALAPLFAAAYAAAPRRLRAAATAILLLCAVPGLRAAAGDALSGLAAPRVALWPQTATWLEAHVPPDAAVVDSEPYLTTLLTGRRAYFPEPAASRDEWLSGLRARGAGFVVIRSDRPSAYLSADAARSLSNFDAWAVPVPPLSLAYVDMAEGRAVLRLDPPVDDGRTAKMRKPLRP